MSLLLSQCGVIEKPYASVSSIREGIKDRLDSCHTQFTRFSCSNPECDHEKIIPNSCMIRYCPKCYRVRYTRALSRMFKYDIKSERLLHVVIGTSRGVLLSRYERRCIEEWLGKFTERCRKELGYNFVGLRICDLNSLDSSTSYYYHYHYALLPEKRSYDTRKMIKILKEVSGGRMRSLRVIGYRYKKAMYKYFAKRIAGDFGHGKNSVFLPSMIDLNTYIRFFYGSRFLSEIGKIPRGLSCSIVPMSDFLTCSMCDSIMIFAGIVEVAAETYFSLDPPTKITDY